MTVIPAKLAYCLNLPVWRRFVGAAEKALSLGENKEQEEIFLHQDSSLESLFFVSLKEKSESCLSRLDLSSMYLFNVSPARTYVEDNVQQMLTSSSPTSSPNKCPFHSSSQGVLQQLTVKEKIDKDEVVNIITDLFLAAADTVSIQMIQFPTWRRKKDAVGTGFPCFLMSLTMIMIIVTQDSIILWLIVSWSCLCHCESPTDIPRDSMGSLSLGQKSWESRETLPGNPESPEWRLRSEGGTLEQHALRQRSHQGISETVSCGPFSLSSSWQGYHSQWIQSTKGSKFIEYLSINTSMRDQHEQHDKIACYFAYKWCKLSWCTYSWLFNFHLKMSFRHRDRILNACEKFSHDYPQLIKTCLEDTWSMNRCTYNLFCIPDRNWSSCLCTRREGTPHTFRIRSPFDLRDGLGIPRPNNTKYNMPMPSFRSE